jgi:hypothetical protein
MMTNDDTAESGTLRKPQIESTGCCRVLSISVGHEHRMSTINLRAQVLQNGQKRDDQDPHSNSQ